MPLKHATETLLIFLLGVVIALVGMLLATFPSFPLGILPAAVLLALTVIYPLSLTRLFKKNRADHLFRWLHWFPALEVFLWGAVQAVAWTIDSLDFLPVIYGWGWTLPAVSVGFLGVFAFCLHVIRRRGARTLLLLAAFVPFTAAAIVSEQGYDWNRELGAILWEGGWLEDMTAQLLKGTGTGRELAQQGTMGEKNLETSQDPGEEGWRERLRVFERRRERIANRIEEEGEDSIIYETPALLTGTGREYQEVETLPSVLPSAGPSVGFLGLTLFMGYAGLLHQRARKRLV